MINPLLLRTFCALVEEGHFTRTAERLHMTQSGVSQHIRKLEVQVGLPLLVRQGKQFTLTDAGERLNTQGVSIIQSLAKLEQELKIDPEYEGDVRIMSPGSVGLKLYPPLLALQQQHPKLKIHYQFAPNENIEKAIAQNKVDLGFMSSKSQHSDVSSDPLTEENLLLVTPANTNDVSWQTLQNLGFIDHPDGAHHANLLLAINYQEFEHIKQFEVTGFSNQIHLILEPISLGLGFTVLPAFAAHAFNKPHLINTHTLAKPVSETLYLCVNRQRPRPNRVSTVINAAKKVLLT